MLGTLVATLWTSSTSKESNWATADETALHPVTSPLSYLTCPFLPRNLLCTHTHAYKVTYMKGYSFSSVFSTQRVGTTCASVNKGGDSAAVRGKQCVHSGVLARSTRSSGQADLAEHRGREGTAIYRHACSFVHRLSQESHRNWERYWVVRDRLLLITYLWLSI